jgi:YVTN family beta-propeller protein
VTVSIVSGALPTGLSISSSGLVTGTTSAVGAFSWSVHAVDVDGRADTLPDSNVVTDTIIYTSNNLTNDVYAIRHSNGALLATIPVGLTASGVAINPAESRIYVANASGDSVSVIDTSSNTVTATVAVGTNPVDVCVSKDGTRGYTANQTGNTVSVIDLVNNVLITTVAKGASPNACNTNLINGDIYVVSAGNSTVYVLNADGSTKASVSFTNPSGVAASPDGLHFFVVGYDGITAFNATTYAMEGNYNVRGGYGPISVAITPDGNTAYVSDYINTDVKVINVANKSAMTLAASIAGVGKTNRIAMDAFGRKAYATVPGVGVRVIDVASNTVDTTYPYGNFGIAVEKVSS